MKFHAPIVSIYLVNHNYGRYIEQAIQSVLAQTYKEYELLIIDDGSTDNSREIIDKYSNYKNIKVIYQQNKGLTVTNNIALRASSGKFIMRLDADDWLDKNALKILVNVLEYQENVGLVFPDYYKVDVAGEILQCIRRHNFDEVGLYDQPAHGACTMIRKKCLEEIGGYDEAFRCQDGYDLWIRFIQRYQVKNINIPLFYYRQHGSNLTSNEELIYNTRAEILKKCANAKKQNFKSLVVIPVRGGEIDPLSQPLRKLGGKPLIDWTIDCALKSQRVSGIVVTSPEKSLINYINSKYQEKVYCHIRGKHEARPNSYLDDTIRNAAKQYVDIRREKVDAVTVLYIESPFRSHKHIEMSFDLMNIFETDQVVGVCQDFGNLYSHDGHGLKLLNQENLLRLEADEIYREVGNMKTISWNWLFRKSITGVPIVGHVVLNGVATISLSKEWEWTAAEAVAKNYSEDEDEL